MRVTRQLVKGQIRALNTDQLKAAWMAASKRPGWDAADLPEKQRIANDVLRERHPLLAIWNEDQPTTGAPRWDGDVRDLREERERARVAQQELADWGKTSGILPEKIWRREDCDVKVGG